MHDYLPVEGVVVCYPLTGNIFSIVCMAMTKTLINDWLSGAFRVARGVPFCLDRVEVKLT